MRCKVSWLLAVFAIVPFTVGFTPPEEPGTHVSASAGRGRFLSSAGCSNPRLVEYSDQQVGAYHVWKFKGNAGTRLGAGVDFNAFESREKVCTETDCANLDPGWSWNDPQFALSPYLTLDWTWFGASAGGHIPFTGFPSSSLDHDISDEWLPIPVRGSLRLGRTDLIYGTAELFSGQPLNSGMPAFFGLGGRVLGFDLWGGISEFSPETGYSGVVARQVGPVRLRVAGGYRSQSVHYEEEDNGIVEQDFMVNLPNYGISTGLEYHIPW